MKTILSFSLAILFLASCSSNKTCKYEADYNSVSDSLKVAIEKNKMTELTEEKIYDDFTTLSCSDYQQKYKLSDQDLAVSIQGVRTTISILGAFEGIEKNIKVSEEEEIDRLLEKGDEASEDIKDIAE